MERVDIGALKALAPLGRVGSNPTPGIQPPGVPPAALLHEAGLTLRLRFSLCLGAVSGRRAGYTFSHVKIFFIPFSVVSGLIAGFISKKLFDAAWGLVDDEQPPEPTLRPAPVGKILLAAALQGAVFRGTRAIVDRYARTAFQSLTGVWPGEEEPASD